MGGEPALTPIDSDEYRAASMAMEEAFGKKPIPVRSGGSIPIYFHVRKGAGIKNNSSLVSGWILMRFTHQMNITDCSTIIKE